MLDVGHCQPALAVEGGLVEGPQLISLGYSAFITDIDIAEVKVVRGSRERGYAICLTGWSELKTVASGTRRAHQPATWRGQRGAPT